LLQVNSRNIYNKPFDFWNVIDIYNSAAVGTETWLSEEGTSYQDFRANYTTFKRDGYARGDGVFILLKSNITWAELWFDELHEMIAIELKAGTHKKGKS
jgi:hypothetical protein